MREGERPLPTARLRVLYCELTSHENRSSTRHCGIDGARRGPAFPKRRQGEPFIASGGAAGRARSDATLAAWSLWDERSSPARASTRIGRPSAPPSRSIPTARAACARARAEAPSRLRGERRATRSAANASTRRGPRQHPSLAHFRTRTAGAKWQSGRRRRRLSGLGRLARRLRAWAVLPALRRRHGRDGPTRPPLIRLPRRPQPVPPRHRPAAYRPGHRVGTAPPGRPRLGAHQGARRTSSASSRPPGPRRARR